MRKYKQAGKLAEKYLIKFIAYKPALSKLGVSEYDEYIFYKKDNKKYIPKNFPYDALKISLSEDFADENEVHEFKFTEKEYNKDTRMKEAFCQANLYAFIRNHQNNPKGDKKKEFIYKILVEIYVFEKNKIYSYKMETNLDLAKKICEFCKKQYNIDLYSLIIYGKYSGNVNYTLNSQIS
ncbi:MAG: hypothetical protein B6U88_02170 [Candidatus Aenigmarchaeota archaeon ex4484_56]|nr:MAG: hypothetical protein B6U88_02170 [Candidatus Aenigmarchaeota archaeon ex4484_56]